MSNYSRAATHERRVKRQLEAAGYFVVRSAGSKGIADLVALPRGGGRPLIIQCKSRAVRASAAELELLRRTAETFGATAVVAQGAELTELLVHRPGSRTG
jgi:Holliday junction resolvase